MGIELLFSWKFVQRNLDILKCKNMWKRYEKKMCFCIDVQRSRVGSWIMISCAIITLMIFSQLSITVSPSQKNLPVIQLVKNFQVSCLTKFPSMLDEKSLNRHPEHHFPADSWLSHQSSLARYLRWHAKSFLLVEPVNSVNHPNRWVPQSIPIMYFPISSGWGFQESALFRDGSRSSLSWRRPWPRQPTCEPRRLGWPWPWRAMAMAEFPGRETWIFGVRPYGNDHQT